MFHYLLTPLDQHFDLGFGAVADSFKEAADTVLAAPSDRRGLNEHLPGSFLYRHAIELYLKSGIIIFHRRLELPYGEEPAESEPRVKVGSEWKLMYRVHSLVELYQYYRTLFSDHAEYLRSCTKTNWSFPPGLDGWVEEIESRDSTSTFFRYPVTKHRERDPEKSLMKEDDYQNIIAKMGPGRRYVRAYVVTNPDGEIIRAFQHDDEVAQLTLRTLSQASQVFHDCHAAMRAEFTGGW